MNKVIFYNEVDRQSYVFISRNKLFEVMEKIRLSEKLRRLVKITVKIKYELMA